MPNTYFQFKQFLINQDKVAMKVCTDACLFGAWVADKMYNQNKLKNVLDIGAGSGLLSLMIAQKIKASIDAIEIDAAAAQQAKENFEASPWKENLQVTEADVRSTLFEKRYDLIISNPPFFDNDLKSPNKQRNLALHNDSLTRDELITSVVKSLKPKGIFAVLLPCHRAESFIELAASQDLFVSEKTQVKQTEKHSCFRSMLLFVHQPADQNTSEIVIKREGKYSKEFIELLKDYYLHL